MVIFRRNYRQELLQKSEFSKNQSPKLKHFFLALLLAASSITLCLHIIDIQVVSNYLSYFETLPSAPSTSTEMADSARD